MKLGLYLGPVVGLAICAAGAYGLLTDHTSDTAGLLMVFLGAYFMDSRKVKGFAKGVMDKVRGGAR